MIKYFGVWPVGLDKNNLFEEQKTFIIYLMGTITSLENWNIQTSYHTELEEIKNLKKVDIENSDFDVARLQGRNIEEMKQERLEMEKERRINELKKKYGIKEEEKFKKIPEMPEIPDEKQKLWEILEGKGLIKNGLQNKT